MKEGLVPHAGLLLRGLPFWFHLLIWHHSEPVPPSLRSWVQRRNFSSVSAACVHLRVSVCPPCQGTVVGGRRGGEAYFNRFLKEINGLQMAQSIYSNETASVAVSIEQRAGALRRWGLNHLRSRPDRTAKIQPRTWMQLHVSAVYNARSHVEQFDQNNRLSGNVLA